MKRSRRANLPRTEVDAHYRYHRDVLSRGLRVVTIETPHLHSAMVAVYVRVGSRHETPRNTGVSHFLEHLFFRGSARYPDTVAMNAAVEELGGNLNGITTRDHSYYYTPIHPQYVGVGLDILGDMLTHPRLTQMEIERSIILEEILDEVDERGRDIDLENLTKRHLFGKHPMGLKIAGTPESVRRLSKSQVKEHFARFYVRPNAVVTVVGAVDRQRVLEQVERAFRALPPGAPCSEDPPPPGPSGPTFRCVPHEEAQTEFRATFRTVPEAHPDFTVLGVIRRIIDDGLSSRLPFEVVERRGLAYAVHAGMEAYNDVGLFDVEAACSPTRSAQVLEATLRVLAGLCERRVSDDELERAKRRYRILLEFSQDSPADLAGWYGGTELFRPPESFATRCALVDAVTADQLREVARTYFTRENLSVLAVGPREGRRALERMATHSRLLA